MPNSIKATIDELANVATTLEFELQQNPVSQPRTAALRRLLAVHRKELNTALTQLQSNVPKKERTPRVVELRAAHATADSADSDPADFPHKKELPPGQQPSDVGTE